MNATLSAGSVASLWPDVNSISWWQLVIAPILLGVVVLLPRARPTRPSTPPSSQLQTKPLHLFQAKTSHARYLPTLAKHVFSYPVLYFGFDLDALEAGQLNLGRSFGYRPKGWSLTGLRPDGYLGKASGKDDSIRHKLNDLMLAEGVRLEEVAKVYSVTMPEYCALEGINPLTTHFGYKVTHNKERGEELLELKVIVLEVHNTFGETHAYMLRTRVAEDEQVPTGFDHQFTFPRAFHVSPFNDRTGFYRVAVVDPLKRNPAQPDLNIRIVFLTPQMEKKIFADLRGTGTPLSRPVLLRALARWPLSLFMTLPRILWQAGKLHYAKRLDVFPRPEPYARLPSDEEGQHVRGEAVEDEEEIVNPVEMGGRAGGLGWLVEGAGDRWAKERVTSLAERRVKEMWKEEERRVRVVLHPADKAVEVIDINPSPLDATQSADRLSRFTANSTSAPAQSHSSTPVEILKVFYLTPAFFSDLVACPTAQLAYELGSLTERRWRVNTPELFLDLFKSPPTPLSLPLSTRIARRLRLSTIRWALGFAPPAALATGSPAQALLGAKAWPAHPLDSSEPSDWAMASTLFWNVFALKASYWAFVVTRARFVVGMETWGEWARWAERVASPAPAPAGGKVAGGARAEGTAKIEFGSVLRK